MQDFVHQQYGLLQDCAVLKDPSKVLSGPRRRLLERYNLRPLQGFHKAYLKDYGS